MRLWHYKLLPFLDIKRLIRQHCECCALRGNGWGRKHATVNYVFTHPLDDLVQYHYQVIHEMERRGYKLQDLRWLDASYRGVSCPSTDTQSFVENEAFTYPEHNDAYLKACLLRLLEKSDRAAKKTVEHFLLSQGNTFFDAEVHSKAFYYYCEVVILPDGKIRYATPSHERLMLSIYGAKRNLTVEETIDFLRAKDMMMHIDEMMNDLGCVLVWYDSIAFNTKLTRAQLKSLSMLIEHKCVSDELLDDIQKNVLLS